MATRHFLFQQNGSVLVEALVVAPVLIGGLTLFLSTLILAGSLSLLRDRLDETLICLTHRPRAYCENQFQQFARRTGIARLGLRSRFIRQGSLWTGDLFVENPWGKDITVSRSLNARLSKNFR